MIFLTGSTGYVGSYLVDTFRRTSDEHLLLFVRASSAEHAEQRLWKALQLHMDFETFLAFVRSRVSIVLGDLTGHNLGFDDPTWAWASEHTTSILHCAASLNRKSAKACLNVNLRGTLSVVRLGRDAHTHHGLRRFTDVSTVAVSGTRRDEVVREDDAIDWDRSDYDPYGRTRSSASTCSTSSCPTSHASSFVPRRSSATAASPRRRSSTWSARSSSSPSSRRCPSTPRGRWTS